MIEYLNMSIFDSPAECLVNLINCEGAMGKGLALEFKKRYPTMFLQYQRDCMQKKMGIGMLSLYTTSDIKILNFPTKEYWRYPSRLIHIEYGLRTFNESYEFFGLRSISFPKLGCGLGGLDWKTQVQPLMVDFLSNLSIDVYIHLGK